MSISQEEFESLKKENEALKAKLNKSTEGKEKRKKASVWFAKKFSSAFAGRWLKNSFVRLYKEIPENKVQTDTLADVTASLLWRLTRIGILTLFFAILPTMILLFQSNLLMRQNKILSQQSVRLDQQTNLAEANRRGTVMLEMSNIMDQVDYEVNNFGGMRKATKSRIISHVQALKPYKFLENDELIAHPLSPERAQLFLYILTSKLSAEDKIDIFKNTKFSYADLNDAYLNFVDASEAKLPMARLNNLELLGSDWDGVEMQQATISYSHIEGSSFTSSNFERVLSNQSAYFQVTFNNCDFNQANFQNNLFSNTSFKSCNWSAAVMTGSVFSATSFSGLGDLSKANWDNAIVDSKNWLENLKAKKVKGADQLIADYKVTKEIDLIDKFAENNWLSRFMSMNNGKTYYLLEKR